MATRALAVAPTSPAPIDLAPLHEATDGLRGVTDSLKGDLAQVTKSNLALSKQLSEAHLETLNEMDKLAVDIQTNQNLTNNRIENLEQQIAGYRNWFWALLSLMLVLMALMIALLVVK